MCLLQWLLICFTVWWLLVCDWLANRCYRALPQGHRKESQHSAAEAGCAHGHPNGVKSSPEKYAIFISPLCMHALHLHNVCSTDGRTPCMENNGGCSHLCLYRGGIDYVCACPTPIYADSRPCVGMYRTLTHSEKSVHISWLDFNLFQPLIWMYPFSKTAAVETHWTGNSFPSFPSCS